MKPEDYNVEGDVAWCPGCGNFAIIRILKQTLAEMGIAPRNLVVTSGIGQAAKAPQYFNNNYFNGLHGRSIPPATGIKVANPNLVVVAESGDGCMYGEGGNHFIHAIRRNSDITVIVHNNMVYGLTKGQASPTSEKGMKTPVQTDGVYLEPFNPISTAIALDASFVARAFAGHVQQTKEIVKRAIEHKGFSLIDLFQPCITFNKQNTFQWFNDNTYYLEGHDESSREAAFAKSIETDKLPLGVFYTKEKPGFVEFIRHNNMNPMHDHIVDKNKLKGLVESFK